MVPLSGTLNVIGSGLPRIARVRRVEVQAIFEITSPVAGDRVPRTVVVRVEAPDEVFQGKPITEYCCVIDSGTASSAISASLLWFRRFDRRSSTIRHGTAHVGNR